jgi:hypothetical protein
VSTAIVKNAPKQLATTPMHLIEMAVAQGADVDKLAKLMDLQMRWEQDVARKAFVAAMTRFKADPPTIVKNKHVKHNDFWHATLDNVVEVAAGALSKVGITHRWRTSCDPKIRVTCILTHELGHSEETTLEAGPDTSGSKNSIQAIASTVTYLERYTLLAATGLATQGQDNDGKTEGLSGDNVEDHLLCIRESMSTGELQKVFAEAYNAAKTVNDKQAMDTFIKAKDQRKRELA